MHGILDALVVVMQLPRIAAPARLAVEEVVRTSHTTNTTAVAMKRLFTKIVVVEIADLAVVCK
jgi:hypothetical protein